jgi:hypothetical protein
MLILTEECGMQGTVPDFFYDVFSTPANMPFFADPIKHKKKIEELLKRKIRIYEAGKRMPTIHVSLVSTVESKPGIYNPSGIFPLPLKQADVVLNPSALGDRRYETRNYERSKQGALQYEVATTQHRMLADIKGIHYNFLCREIVRETTEGSEVAFEDEFKTFVANNVGVSVEGLSLSHMYNVPSFALNYLKGLNLDIFPSESRATARELQAKAEAILRRRQSSGESLHSAVLQNAMRLLLVAKPDQEAIHAALAAVPDELINAHDSRSGRTLLMNATRQGNKEAFLELLRRKADPSLRTFDGATALTMAASRGHGHIVSILLSIGMDVNTATADGTTPLHEACSSATLRNQATVRLLLAAKANPNAQDDEGYTPLAIATGYAQAPIIPDLLAAGADPVIPIYTGQTPILLALKDSQPEVAEALLASGKELGITMPALQTAITRKYDGIALELAKRMGRSLQKEGALKRAREIGGTPGLVEWLEARRRSSSARRKKSSSGTRRRSKE